MNNVTHSIVMIGATGAVGSCVATALANDERVQRLSLLGRRPLEGIEDESVAQHKVDVFEPSTYRELLGGHDVAICTLGVGQPSKISKEEFVRTDKTAVLAFATECKAAGIRHFELLASVSVSAQSASFYLRTKGELINELKKLNFERLSIFQPSMILTPTNRYGLSQAITLKVWPLLNIFLLGSLKKYRGVPVQTLGNAMAKNIFSQKQGFEALHWEEFMEL